MYESPGPQWILDSTLWIPDCVAEKRSVFSVRESLFVSFSFNGNTSRISSAWWKVITSVCCVINRVIGKCLFSRLRYGFVCILLKVGEHQTVLITEDSKDGAHFVGHNKYYDQVSDWNQCASVLPSFLFVLQLKILYTERQPYSCDRKQCKPSQTKSLAQVWDGERDLGESCALRCV